MKKISNNTFLIDTAEELSLLRENDTPCSFVPTMGNLHEGHLQLIKMGLDLLNLVYVSIFVNPTQFAANEDFHSYPRTLEEDLKKLVNLMNSYPQKKIVVYAPKSAEEIYSPQFSTLINVPHLSKELEGIFRPDHFGGVCTVVYLLFQQIKPIYALFGKKDYQQWKIIEKMTKDLRLGIEIIGVETVRNADGLALSSRNNFLTDKEKIQALNLRLTLLKVRDYLMTNTASNFFDLNLLELFTTKSEEIDWDYLELRDSSNLKKENQTSIKTTHFVILGVYRLGKVRLIDNIEFTLKDQNITEQNIMEQN